MEARAKLFGHPIHQMLIAFPLGLLAAALAFDVIALVRDGHDGLHTASYYMIAAGVISGLAAAVFGLIDFLAIPAGTRAKRVGRLHGGGNVVVVVFFAASWYFRRGTVPDPPTIAIVLAALGAGLATMTAWLGGELVDRLGVGVDDGAHLRCAELTERPGALTVAKTASDVLIDTLQAWGVEVVFGLPGDGINGIMESLRQRADAIRFVQVRHEESAAFMACAYAKYTGRLGVCLATSGPGGLHLLNGLYDAKLDGQPVLAITGHHYHDLIGTYAQQDVDLDRVFADVAVYSQRIMGPAHVENVATLACRMAIARRGVAHINFPVDLQEAKLEKGSARNVPDHTSDVLSFGAAIPCDDDLRRAADLLNAGKKTVILAGRGALGAGGFVEAAAARMAAPIVKPLLGKAVVPDDSPFTTGGIGLLGTRPSQEALEECDTLLLIGTSFPYIEFLPKPDQARAVQIDVDPVRIGLRYPVEVGLAGDSKRTLEKLVPLLAQRDDRGFLENAQEGMREWWMLMETRGTRTDRPMKPQVVAWELGKRLADDAIVSCDSGTVATWFARQIKARRGQMFSLSGTLASMGNGLPYAIAAQIAYPGRQCVAFVGDGGFTMLMGELATAVKYGLPIKVIVIKNNTLGMIKWEQMVFLGNPEYGCELHPIDFAAFARACGAAAMTIDDPQRCGEMLDEALRTPGPVVVEAIVDPFEPPMPAKITPKQALHLAESLAKGEPNRKEIALTLLADKVKEMV